MAGDWIVWTKGLSRKPEVLAIAARTGRHHRVVACLLMEFWEWADEHTVDGFLSGLSVRSLSASQADTDEDFWRTVISVGWLEASDDGIRIPHHEYWMGKSAKRRLQENKRKNSTRASHADTLRTENGQMSASQADEMRPTEQYSTEEDKTPPNPPQGGGEDVRIRYRRPSQPDFGAAGR